MTQRQAVKYLGTYLWKRERFGAVFTLIFAIYMGSIISLDIDSTWKEDEFPRVLGGMVDWIYLTMFPIFGMVMNKTSIGMWRDDYYTKRTAHWRTMPIPIAAIVQARYLQTAVVLPIISVVFLLLQYVVAPNLRESISLMQWIENGLIWICYAFIINVLFVLWELGYSGKLYCLFYFGFMLMMSILVAILTWQRVHLFQEMLKLTQEGHAPVIIIGLAITVAAAFWIGNKVTINRIKKRSITF